MPVDLPPLLFPQPSCNGSGEQQTVQNTLALDQYLVGSAATAADPKDHPELVAKQAADLDVLTGGCFRLGVGIGWNPIEFRALEHAAQLADSFDRGLHPRPRFENEARTSSSGSFVNTILPAITAVLAAGAGVIYLEHNTGGCLHVFLRFH